MSQNVQYLEQITKELWDFPLNNVVDEVAYIRFTNAVEEGQTIINALCAPYVSHPQYNETKELILVLHGIARIIDDAIDIGLPEDRIRMLKVLPFIWNIASDFQTIFPNKKTIILSLIRSWCHGNNPSTDTLDNIGYKNMHLLLIEELLHNGNNRIILKHSLILLQLVDEINILERSEWIPLLHGSETLIEEIKKHGFSEFASIIQNNVTLLQGNIYVE